MLEQVRDVNGVGEYSAAPCQFQISIVLGH